MVNLTCIVDKNCLLVLMASSQNYYRILQVKPSADLDTIKKAYRQKMRLYHPDKFVAELSDLKQTGNVTAIRKLEREIEHAKQMTQRINGAYAVLSDAHERAAYDRFLSEERQRKYNQEKRQQRVQNWEDGRRTVKTRPHHRNPNRPQSAPKEGIPWFILGGLILMLLFVSALFSNAITRTSTPFTTYVPRNPTAEGSIRMIDLQATANSEQATSVARSTIVFEPTSTPRSSSDNESLGDRFVGLGNYQTAVDVYTEAILASPNNATLFLKRASAYTALYYDNYETSFPLALEDYQQAIHLDATLADAYLGRGLLYYDVWLSSGDYAEEARADLETYLTLGEPENSEEINAILDELP